MRYRGKISVEFTDKSKINLESINIGDSIEEAKKKFIIEFVNSYKNNPNVKNFEIIFFKEDSASKPSFDFVKESLLNYNDTTKNINVHNKIRDELYKAFCAYTPNWDDDGLFDILSYCENGELNKIIDEFTNHYHKDGLTLIVNNLLEELDGEWVCHYRPEQSLEEQYKKAISNSNFIIRGLNI